jgi:dTDP-4-dehydrorhamnose reductase
MRVLITGGHGQLGHALHGALTEDDVSAPGHSDLDVTDRTAVKRLVEEFRPDVVIHSAAWTDTAGCETDPERAIAVNAIGAGHVAEACATVGATIVYVSTNEVFDGEALEAYDENSTSRPLNSYGLSKLAGERAVAMALERHAIVRTSWLYGPGRSSFPEKVLASAGEDGKLRMVTDEVASPTCTLDLAAAIARLITTEPRGVFHLVNAGGCSRLEWAEAILETAGMAAIQVEAVTQADFGAPYRKPAFSVLANSRAAALGIEMRPWRVALDDYFRLSESLSAAAPSKLQ